MAFNASTATLAQWLAIAPACGLPAKNFAPASFYDQAITCATNAKPPGAPADFVSACTPALIARGIIYYKNVPGDCGTPTQIQPSIAASEENTALSAVSGIASMTGAAIPGIGPFLSSIIGIFGQAHAQAVANEQSTICQVAGIINQAIAYCDSLVVSGKISPATAYAGLQAYIAQVTTQLQSIEKKCNAACVYQGQLAAHAAFAQTYYAALAPAAAFTSAPGAAPSQLGEIPGGVIAVGEGVAVSVFQPAANALGISTESFLFILLALIALFGIGLAVL
jgi:hypothetical protein